MLIRSLIPVLIAFGWMESSLVFGDIPLVDTKAILKTVAEKEDFRSAVRQLFGSLNSSQQATVKSSLSAMASGRSLQPSGTAFDAIVAKSLVEHLLPDMSEGESKMAIKSVTDSGDLFALLAFLSPNVDVGPDDTVPLLTADTRLTKKQKRALELRFSGQAWNVPSDTQQFAEYHFLRDGTAVRLNGPDGSQWGKVFPWEVRKDGIVQVGGPGHVRTYWFWFRTADKGTFAETQVSKGGTIIPANQVPIQRLPSKKLPKYSDKQP